MESTLLSAWDGLNALPDREPLQKWSRQLSRMEQEALVQALGARIMEEAIATPIRA